LYSETEKIYGDKVKGYDCHIKLPTTFANKFGKCQFENADVTPQFSLKNINPIGKCESLCGINCTAYEYTNDLDCKTFLDTSLVKGDETKDFQCSIKDKRVTADYLKRKGHCTMRKEGKRIAKFNSEGIVSDLDSCLVLCERIGNECIGYEMSSITNECFTF